MGCVSSAYLQEEEGGGGGTMISHHIVSLTSTTYGLLTTLDQPTTTTTTIPAATPTLTPVVTSPPSSPHEVINSWELMAGLDPVTPMKPKTRTVTGTYPPSPEEKRCPPGGEDAVVLYTTTLRGVRKTFEDCNAVRSAVEGIGVSVRERDVSMDLGFREELRRLMKGKGEEEEGPTVPRLFVKGRDVGGAEQVLRIHEEGELARLLEGMPRRREGICDGCGGIRFIPCFRCSGSRKVVVAGEWRKKGGGGGGGLQEKGKVVRCADCNENGLVLCPICC